MAMPDSAKGTLIGMMSVALGLLAGVLINLAAGSPLEVTTAMAIGMAFGMVYGVEAALLVSYDMGAGKGWLQLLVDFTWSLPNTVFGFVFGNLIYLFFGLPNRDMSRDRGYIAFKARGSGGFGHDVLQTLGTVNLGGAGQHELMHVMQARIFGPLYLPLFAVNYVVNFVLQGLWTITVGMLLWALKVRDTPYFRPPSQSAVSGYFGWIYYATFFELWAYSAGNP